MFRHLKDKALEQLFYIQIPSDMTKLIQDFPLNPDIRLPIDAGIDKNPQALKDLSWEMIVAGLLKIMTFDRSHTHFSYYKDLSLYLRPDLIRELSTAGIQQASDKNWELAEEIFLALEGLEPDNSRVLLNLAILYDQYHSFVEDRNQDEEAIYYRKLAKERYSVALAASDPVTDAYLYAGLFSLKIGHLENAQENIQTFLTLSKDEEKKSRAKKALQDFEHQNRMDILFKESFDFIQLGQENVALEKIGLFLEKNSEIWNAWFLKGWAHRRLSQFEEGKEAFLRALELGGTQTDTYNELALCLMELQDYKSAKKYLTKALTKDTENTKIITNLGILALKLGNTAEAEGFFRTSLEYDPQEPIALQYLQKISKN